MADYYLSGDLEPFWYQDPSWAHTTLHYYPDFGFVDHPIYIDHKMDGSLVYIGHGTKEGKKGTPHTLPQKKRQCSTMVEVYIDEDFVQEVPLQLLRRFSGVAKTQFPAYAQGSPQLHEKADTIVNGTEEVSPAGPRSTDGTNLSSRGPSKALNPSAPAFRSAKTPQHMTLSLTLAGVDPDDFPRAQFLRQAVRWMESNSNKPSTQEQLEYGPSEPGNFSFLDLLEMYQAAVAFQIQPRSAFVSIKRELLSRVTEAGPESDLEILQHVTTYLPVYDPVTVRAITGAWDKWSNRVYNKDEWLAIKSSLVDSENQTLAKKARRIFKHRMRAKKECKESEIKVFNDRAAEAHEEEWWRLVKGTPSSEPSEQDVVGGHRRRNRRAQQQRGKEA